MPNIVEFIFKGTNRSAIRAMEEIAATSDETKDKLVADAEESSVSLDKVGESAAHTRDSMVGLAGLVGIGGVVFGLKDMSDTAVALQSDQSQLVDALNQTGQAAGGTAAELERMAEAGSTQGGFGTTENLQALTQFVRETRSATEAQHLLGLATDIARSQNIDLSDSQSLVARAYAGSARGLQQLLGPMVTSEKATVGLTTAHERQIDALENESALMGKMGGAYVRTQETNDHITAQQAELAELTDKRATATQVLAAATDYFAGSTAAFDEKTAGKASNLENALHNLDEELGTALLPTMNRFLGVGMHVADWMSEHKSTVLDMALAFGSLGAAMALRAGIHAVHDLYTDVRGLAVRLKGLVTSEEEAGAAMTETGAAAEGAGIELAAAGDMGAMAGEEMVLGATEAGIAWDTFMSATVVGLLFVGLIELVEHWHAVERAGVDAFHFVEHAASDAWGWIKDHWKTLVEVFLAPVEPLALLITHLKDVERYAKDAAGEVEKVFGGIAHDVTHPFGLHFSQGGVVPEHLATGGIAGGMTPVGTDTVPAMLTPGEGVVDTSGMSVLGSRALSLLNAGQIPTMAGGQQSEKITITPQSTIVLRTTDRQLGEATVRWALNRAARGVGSLAGGSLVTGAPGLPL